MIFFKKITYTYGPNNVFGIVWAHFCCPDSPLTFEK